MVGADIVSVVVLERVSGRAVDDFTVVWPASAAVDRVLTGLAAIPGVRVDGVWRGTELSEPSSGREVALIGQVAANPGHGLATVVDAAPALFGADWAVAIQVGSDWAGGGARPGMVRLLGGMRQLARSGCPPTGGHRTTPPSRVERS
ncbi:ACT domain-containing protein [Dactylosporangium darangshiense]|uniref:hypothetical protein n=1 Tax=Dactylosporangium darangshiense TaxID=579108 RepID=UPI0036417D01